jgi:ubiquinone/menaquinone biosynthesis C-methylase UbiE
MDHREAGRYWEGNAAAWTQLSRLGCDVYRDEVNTPAFLELLPDVAGMSGLDVGCGDGHNTRLFAGRGARMDAVDIAPTFLRFAREAEHRRPLGIRYIEASGLELPFRSGHFDFVTAVMSLMDMPGPDVALRESHRVLQAGGFLQFSILHPCLMPLHRRLVRDREGTAYAVEVGRYFEQVDGEIERWMFSAAPVEAKAGLKEFEVPRFHRTLAEWLNAIIDTGFAVERLAEPRADEETAKRVPAVADTRIAPYFLHVRCRKPRAPVG